MKYVRLYTIISLIVLSIMTAGADVPFNIPGKLTTTASICVVDLKADTVVYEWKMNDFLIPASVMKSVTAASVVKTRDIHDKFATTTVVDGKIKNGVVEGNLVVKVTGDPTVESAHFKAYNGICDSIVSHLKQRGIKEIKGNVIVETTDFVEQPVPQGWMTEDVVWPYGAGHFAANYCDNTFVLYLPTKKSSPTVPCLKFDHRPSSAAMSVKRQKGSPTLILNGKMPRSGYSVKLAMPQPESALMHAVKTAVTDNGIAVDDETIGRGKGKENIVYTHYSPDFEKILRSLMVRSDNMMAEGMLRAVAKGGTRQDAIDTEIELWSEAGLPTYGVKIEDGSGLSRNDRLSALFLADMYRYMARSDKAKQYVALFPVAGHDGTMRNFLKGTPLDGKMAMKTGSMRGVQGYGGFKLDDNGNPTHAVVVLVNNFTCDRAKLRSEIQKLLLKIFE